MPEVLLLRSSRHLGGIERQLLDHTLRLRAAGWQPYLLCLFRGPGEHPLVTAARQHELPALTLPDPQFWHGSAWRALRGLLRQRPHAILHSCDYRSDIMGGILRRGRRHVAESHGHTAEGWRMAAWNQLDGWVLRRLPAVVGVSADWAATLQRHGLAADRCYIIGNSRTILPSSPPPSPVSLPGAGPHLLYAGRLSPEKGLHVLLRSWPQIRHSFPGARLWIMGSPAPPGYARRLRPGLQQAGVHTIGYQPDIRPWLLAVDVVIVPSLRETWGMTAFEALCAGKRLIASAIGGLPELCRNAPHAHLIPAGDAAALAAGVRRVLRPDFPHGQQAGQQFCQQERFDPERRCQQWLAVYETITP